jgi:hypothetical protein
MKRAIWILGLAVAITGLITGCSSVMQGGSILQAQSSMQRGKYQKAIDQLSQGWGYTKTNCAAGAEICYMKGVCYQKLGFYDDAEGMFKYTVEHYPETPYGYMAKARLEDKNTQMFTSNLLVFTDYYKQAGNAITNRWNQLMDSAKGKRPPEGWVELKFNIHTNGEVSDLKVTKNTSTELAATIAEKAITNSAPYGNWTPAMIQAVDKPYVPFSFTFYYW